MKHDMYYINVDSDKNFRVYVPLNWINDKLSFDILKTLSENNVSENADFVTPTHRCFIFSSSYSFESLVTILKKVFNKNEQ